jgi:hypothetical protein
MRIGRNTDQDGERFFSEDRIRRGAAAAISQTLRAGVAAYERDRDLPRLARILPGETTDSAESAEAIVARLERALRAERNRARAGHWTYDLNRHIALRQAYLAERQRLDALIAERRGN